MQKIKKILKTNRFYTLLKLLFIFGVVLFNYLFNKEVTINKILLILLMAVLCELILFGIISLSVRALPKKLFDYNNKIYKQEKWEIKFFNLIKVKKWKNLVPEMGEIFVGFQKSKVADINDSDYLAKFIEETCYAEFMHKIGAVSSFGILVLFPAKYILPVILPVCIFVSFLHVLPVIIQRYTRPRLIIAYNRAIRKNNTTENIMQEDAVTASHK